HRRGEYVELRPFDLQQVFQMLHDIDRVERRRRHYVVRLGETRGRAVVEHHAIVAQHDAVAAAPDCQRIPAVDVDAVEELGDVASLQLDLPQRGHVDHADVA